MITPSFVHTMARYNQWQNNSLYQASSVLDDEARKLERGSFFQSIHGTLCHLLWGDQMWMRRFAGTPAPKVSGIGESADMITDWRQLCAERKKMDEIFLDWGSRIEQSFLDGELSWHSGAAGREVSKPVGELVIHMFNHQTHHRGQVHAMLTAAGAMPDDTDLFLMPKV